MRRLLLSSLMLLTVAGALGVAGCGSGDLSKVSGIYNSANMTLTLTSDGSATLKIPPVPAINLEGEKRNGTYTFDGKEIRIKFSDGKDAYTFKVAGEDLIETSTGAEGEVWKKD